MIQQFIFTNYFLKKKTIFLIGGKKGFKKSPSTNSIILDQNFWIIEVGILMIISMTMFLNRGQFIFVIYSSSMLIHSFWKLFACLVDINILTIITAKLIDNISFIIVVQGVFKIIKLVKQGIGGFVA